MYSGYYILSNVHCPLSIVFHIQYTGFCISSTVHCIRFNVYCLVFNVSWVLSTIYYILSNVHFLLSIVYHIPSTGSCLSSTVYCPLSTVKYPLCKCILTVACCLLIVGYVCSLLWEIFNPSCYRAILWKKLTAMGFGGTKFLASLQAMYTGDNVTCKVAGVTTRPVYLTRGLRQVSCSYNPEKSILVQRDARSRLCCSPCT